MVSRAIRGAYEPEAVPVQLALRGTWILDRAAAAEIADLLPTLEKETAEMRRGRL